MVRSRTPVPSLFGLLLFMGIPESFPLDIPDSGGNVPLTGLQRAIVYSVELYNDFIKASYPNYFKLRNVVIALTKPWKLDNTREEYIFILDMWETRCQKKTAELSYERTQKCGYVPFPQKPFCLFVVLPTSVPTEMLLTHMNCSINGPPPV